MVDIGDSGRKSDGGVYSNRSLGFAIQHPKRVTQISCFCLYLLLMKSYPSRNIPLDQKIFNYRLTRARMVIENTFGNTTSRFTIFRRPIIAKVEKVI